MIYLDYPLMDSHKLNIISTCHQLVYKLPYSPPIYSLGNQHAEVTDTFNSTKRKQLFVYILFPLKILVYLN